MTKAKMAVVVGLGVLLAAGTATVTVKEIQEYKTYSWEIPNANIFTLFRAHPQVVIVPTKFSEKIPGSGGVFNGAVGVAQTLKEIIQTAYGKTSSRTVVETDLPTNRYDFIAKLGPPIKMPIMTSRQQLQPIETNWIVELQKEIKTKFGIGGHLEMRNTDVLILQPSNEGVRNFKVGHLIPPSGAIQPILNFSENGVTVGYGFHAQSIWMLQSLLESGLQIPVINETGLTEDYDFSLSWIQSPGKPDPNVRDLFGLEWPKVDELNPILLNELGLELVPTNMPIEILVVEKVR